MKKFISMFMILALMFTVLVGCSNETKEEKKEDTKTENVEEKKDVKEEEKKEETKEEANNPVVTIEMESGDKIVVELYPEIAPNSVANFVELVQNKFYDGVIFHRVIEGFMIQGGDPDGIGTGGPGYMIKGEFASNGFDNKLQHERGVISMARAMHPDSAGSQFFIMHANAPHLDGEYAAFGKVIEGIEVVDKIATVEKDEMDKPLEEQKMKTVTVDTKGVEYKAEKIQIEQ